VQKLQLRQDLRAPPPVHAQYIDQLSVFAPEIHKAANFAVFQAAIMLANVASISLRAAA
jgi:hypothetical protein